MLFLAGQIFPRGGSNFEITAKLTPPYSLFSNKNFRVLRDRSEELSIRRLNGELTQEETAELRNIDADRFNWLEYYKIKFKGDWFTTLLGSGDKSLVLRTNAEFGFLGNYNNDVGDVPFERFFVGGDGLGNFTLDGRDVVQLRGYENQSLTPVNPLTNQQEGGLDLQ